MSGRSKLAASRALAALASAGLIGVALAGCSPDQNPTDVPGTTPSVISDQPLPPGAVDDVDDEPTGQIATAEIKDTSGKVVGEATFTAPTESDEPVTVSVRVTSGDLPAGFHGMHIHENGTCDAGSGGAQAFTSAGGHLQVDGNTSHPASGDLISINILEDHTGRTVTTTDTVKLEQLFGKSIMIHEKADNFGNIPADKYPGGPNAETLKTGDAGSRIACGVIEEQN
ncbi:superoxide dismutase family protein [Gordonia sp. zg691]|uniref:Superoxide dismutase [Cu-Zn] n=1 Tax=Gordonia jinghuaiqii TaxID=2758710 RepID=A0A7D7RBI6_9ACTN|nr:superoxide dismutase family protein [Gordonia jinghuaiqii]MBD0863362.1 superoxide dismutase family protein [Gordonia jinghuaiqii]MCR5980126.1 superoxide dismutase family protein [Gordonia jinghuaiqii]QMT02110.1 superoxide dismutase family protein [Gordonia jinghuaiqii]